MMYISSKARVMHLLSDRILAASLLVGAIVWASQAQAGVMSSTKDQEDSSTTTSELSSEESAGGSAPKLNDPTATSSSKDGTKGGGGSGGGGGKGGGNGGVTNPEPSSIVLFSIMGGVGAFGVWRRRRSENLPTENGQKLARAA
jgi:hypothetical protein